MAFSKGSEGVEVVEGMGTTSQKQSSSNKKKYWLIGIGIMLVMVGIGVGVGGGVSARKKKESKNRSTDGNPTSGSAVTPAPSLRASSTTSLPANTDPPTISQAATPAPTTSSPTRSPTVTTAAPTTSSPTRSPTVTTAAPTTSSPTRSPTVATPAPTVSTLPPTDKPIIVATDSPTVVCPDDEQQQGSATTIQATYTMRWLANYGVYPYFVPCSRQDSVVAIATCLGSECDTTISYDGSDEEDNVLCSYTKQNQMVCLSTSQEEGSAFYNGPKVTFTCSGPTDESTRVQVEIPEMQYTCPNIVSDDLVGDARGGSQEHQLSLWRVCAKNNQEHPREYTCLGDDVEYHNINGQCVTKDGCIEPLYTPNCKATVLAMKLQSTSLGNSERDCLTCNGSVCPNIKAGEGEDCSVHDDCQSDYKCARKFVNQFSDRYCCQNSYLYLYDFGIKSARVCKNQPSGTDCVFVTAYDVEVPFWQMCASGVCGDDGKCT